VLIVIQLFLVIRIWELSPGGWGIQWYFGTLWALGGGMLICSILVWQDRGWLLGAAVAWFVIAEILTPSPTAWGQKFTFAESIFLIPYGEPGYWVNYPVLQWIELIIFGIFLGYWIAENGLGKVMRKRILAIGAGMLALFVLLRVRNGFGNIQPVQGHSWIDFFNVVKYPPSMSYTLLTTGINLLLLVLFSYLTQSNRKAITRPLIIYGREPLFFYILHLALYAGLGATYAPGGTSLRFVIFFWLYGLLQLLIACVLYSKLKKTARGRLKNTLKYI
jgi:uncharacterized membrane protein